MLDARPLRSAAFRHLAAAYWVNEFGNWIGEIALTLLVYDRTHSPIATAGLFVALRFLPAMAAPLLTLRLETLAARRVLSVLYLLECLLFAGIAWLTHHFSLGAVLVLGGLDGLLAITAKALTRGATASQLLEQGLLREGNGILNLGAMASTAASPVIAGALVAWRGAASALLVDAATFLVTAVIIGAAPDLHLNAEAKRGFKRRLDAISSLVSNQTSLGRLLVAITLVLVAGAIPIPIEVVFVKQTLHASASGYGLLLGAWGVGMVIGGAGFVAGSGTTLGRLLVAGALLNAIAYGGIAASPELAVACGFSLVGGVGNGAAWVAAVTAVQELTPLNSQSAVMSVLESLNQVMPPLGFVAGGVLTAATSPRIAYGAAGGAIMAVVAVAALRWWDGTALDDAPQGLEGHTPPDRLGMQESAAETRKISTPTGPTV